MRAGKHPPRLALYLYATSLRRLPADLVIELMAEPELSSEILRPFGGVLAARPSNRLLQGVVGARLEAGAGAHAVVRFEELHVVADVQPRAVEAIAVHRRAAVQPGREEAIGSGGSPPARYSPISAA